MKIITVLVGLIGIAAIPVAFLPAQTLQLDFSTYLGGSADDWSTAVALDSADQIYLTGGLWSGNFPTQNPYQAGFAPGGYQSAFISKFSSDGSTLIFSTYLSGGGEDCGNCLALDSQNGVYVTGSTMSAAFPTKNPYQASYAGDNSDAFITRLSSSGSEIVYSTYLGGGSHDVGYGICLDSENNAYVTGYSYSTNFPTENPYQAGRGSNASAFISKLSSCGSFLHYSTYLGGSWHDGGKAICLASGNRACVTGQADSRDFPTVNPYQSSFGGGGSLEGDAFISKLSSSGSSLLCSTYLGGAENDEGTGIALGSEGRVHLTGYTESSDFPTENTYQASRAGSRDVFASGLSSDGSLLLYSTYLGGALYDEGSGIALDSGQGISLTGYTNSVDFPTVDPFQGGKAAGSDVFVTRLFSSGSFLHYSSYLGGGGNDQGKSIALNSQNRIYLSGRTASSDFPTADPYQASFAGSGFQGKGDAFVCRLIFTTPSPSASSTPTPSVTPTAVPTVPPPAFSKSFSPDPIVAGGVSTLTFTVDNTLSTLAVTGLNFTDNLPAGLVIAVPANASTTCTGGILTAVSGTAIISYSGGTVGAGSTCTISVDVTGSVIGIFVNLSGDLTSSAGNSGPASDSLTVNATPSPSPSVSPATTPAIPPTPEYLVLESGDYNGDGMADIAVFRQDIGLWAVRGLGRIYFGAAGDVPVSGDYDGDGIADVSVFRPFTGLWAVKDVTRLYFGGGDDLPVPGDYDGDGCCDSGVFDEARGLWSLRGITAVYFGESGDLPVPGDYEGTGCAEIAIFRPSTGLWAVRGITRIYYGQSGDKPLPGSYQWYGAVLTNGFSSDHLAVSSYQLAVGNDQYGGPGTGDEKVGPFASRIAIFRPSSGLWAIRDLTRFYYGSSADTPLIGDFDNNSIDDPLIFRPSRGLWAIRGISRMYYGTRGDIPVTR